MTIFDSEVSVLACVICLHCFSLCLNVEISNCQRKTIRSVFSCPWPGDVKQRRLVETPGFIRSDADLTSTQRA